MSVSYHLIPVDKNTESFIDMNSLKIKLNNDFSIFAELIMNYPNRFIDYFEKDKSAFDFVFTLNESEISQKTYQPKSLKYLFLEILETLKSKDDFPIKKFNYFGYEDAIESTYLYVNLKGRELNKIIEDKIYQDELNFDASASFDKWNNYSESAGIFSQRNTKVHIKSEEGEYSNSNLNINAFPNEIIINRTQSNINLGKEIKKISLILKTPYEHLNPMFQNLINVCDVCIEKGYGIKSFISC